MLFLDSETNKVIDEFDELISIPEGFFEEKEDKTFETESMESLNISQSTANTTLIIQGPPSQTVVFYFARVYTYIGRGYYLGLYSFQRPCTILAIYVKL